MNSQTKILLIVFAGLLLVFLLYNRNSGPTKENFANQNKSQLNNEQQYDNLPKNMEEVIINAQDDCVKTVDTASTGNTAVDTDRSEGNIPIPREDMIKYFPQKDYTPPETDWLEKKFSSRNRALPGQYKRSSYSGSRRGDLGPSDWNAYFDHNNNVIGNSQTGDNDNFLPVDESNKDFAVFKSRGRATCGSNQNCEPEDLFDVDKYLPQEVNDDWFEVEPEPVSIKNRHLINITKPIGVNTIGSSKRNASWDIRGAPSNPRFVVSPWLQSSIEPDTNLKPLL